MPNRPPRLYAPVALPGLRGGTPLTLDGAIQVLETLVGMQHQLERENARILGRYEAVKTKRAKDRWRGELDALRPEFVRVDRAVERLDNLIQDYLDALGKEKEKEEETADEWQFGLEYEATRRGGHDVDLNVNIRRKDGQPMTAAEAQEALRERIETGAFGPQYEFATVLYRSPHSGSARGRTFRDGGFDADSLDDAFDAVIGATNIHDWRMGGIGE